MDTTPDTEPTPAPAHPLRPAPAPVRISLLDLLGIEPPKRLWVSNTILALNVLMFAVMVAAGANVLQPTVDDILRFGANHGPALAAGEWWRLLSAAFVHVGLFHLVFNMWALRSLSVVEALYGNGSFALIYLASALGGSVASALWHPAVVSAGASGAVFGVAGALLVFFARRRRRIPAAIFRPIMRSMLMFIGLNAMFGLLVPGIDDAAHLGGFFIGACAGLALDRRTGASTALDFGCFARGAAVALVPCTFAAFVPWRVAHAPGVAAELLLGKAQDALRLKDWDKVILESTHALEQDPSSAGAYELRAAAHGFIGHDREALADTTRALELDPELRIARDVRAQLRWQAMEGELALADYTELVQRNSNDGELALARALVVYSLGHWSQAANDLRSAMSTEPAIGPEAQIFLWLARVRAGEREAATSDLRRNLMLPVASQPAHLDLEAAAFLVGKIAEAEFLSQCDLSTATMVEKAKIRFVLGSKRLVDGDAQGAHERFEQVLETKALSSPCYWVARYELGRL